MILDVFASNLTSARRRGIGMWMFQQFSDYGIGMLSLVRVRTPVSQTVRAKGVIHLRCRIFPMHSDSFANVCRLIFENCTFATPCEDAPIQKPTSNWNCIYHCLIFYIFIYVYIYIFIYIIIYPCHVCKIIQWGNLEQVPVSNVFGTVYNAMQRLSLVGWQEKLVTNHIKDHATVKSCWS